MLYIGVIFIGYIWVNVYITIPYVECLALLGESKDFFLVCFWAVWRVPPIPSEEVGQP